MALQPAGCLIDASAAINSIRPSVSIYLLWVIYSMFSSSILIMSEWRFSLPLRVVLMQLAYDRKFSLDSVILHVIGPVHIQMPRSRWTWPTPWCAMNMRCRRTQLLLLVVQLATNFSIFLQCIDRSALCYNAWALFLVSGLLSISVLLLFEMKWILIGNIISIKEMFTLVSDIIQY